MKIQSVNPVRFQGLFDGLKRSKTTTPKQRLEKDTVEIKKPSITEEEARENFSDYILRVNEAMKECDRLLAIGQAKGYQDFVDEKTNTKVIFQSCPWIKGFPMTMEQWSIKDRDMVHKFDFSDYKNFTAQGAYLIQLPDKEGKPMVAEVAWGEADVIMPNYRLSDKYNKVQPSVTYYIDNEDNDFAYPISVHADGRKLCDFYYDITDEYFK